MKNLAVCEGCENLVTRDDKSHAKFVCCRIGKPFWFTPAEFQNMYVDPSRECTRKDEHEALITMVEL